MFVRKTLALTFCDAPGPRATACLMNNRNGRARSRTKIEEELISGHTSHMTIRPSANHVEQKHHQIEATFTEEREREEEKQRHREREREREREIYHSLRLD